MRAFVINKIAEIQQHTAPLECVDIPVPEPRDGEVLIRITACGVCHTELDEIEGRTSPPSLPVIPGHQVIGTVERLGSNTHILNPGERVGVAWIFSACGTCQFCRSGNENLCQNFAATGRDRNGGYAEFMTVPESFTYRIPEIFDDEEAAPLLCAGAIGYRSLRLSNIEDGKNLGLVGFGASAHLVMKLARFQYPHTKVFVFTRSESEQEFSRELGAVWAGGIDDNSPELIHSFIDTTPVWKPILRALTNLSPGGRLVINAIRKEDIDKNLLLELEYHDQFWMEKEIKSVANVSRRDVREFLEIAARIPIIPEFQEFKFEDANSALLQLKNGQIRGAKVLRM